MQEEALDFDQVTAALLRLGAEMEAAELHGLMTGLCCAVGAAREGQLTPWLKSPDAEDAAGREAHDLIASMPGIILAELSESECDFIPLLPPDDSELPQRTTALGEWCHGFLSGLATAGITDFSRLPEEASEFCQDLAEISQAGRYQHQENEEDEEAYFELVEYVRVGVMLMHELLNQGEMAPPGSSSVH